MKRLYSLLLTAVLTVAFFVPPLALCGCGAAKSAVGAIEPTYNDKITKPRYVASGAQTFWLSGFEGRAVAAQDAEDGLNKWSAALSCYWQWTQTADYDASRIRVLLVPKATFPSSRTLGRVRAAMHADGRLLWGEVQARDDLSERLLRRVLLHELGHLLMGAGHSDDDRDVMYHSFSLPHLLGTVELSGGDVRTLILHYKSAPAGEAQRGRGVVIVEWFCEG